MKLNVEDFWTPRQPWDANGTPYFLMIIEFLIILLW